LRLISPNRRNRLEPAIAFVNEAKNATFLLAEENPEKKRDFLRSNNPACYGQHWDCSGATGGCMVIVE
jgi:hypothetical protein